MLRLRRPEKQQALEGDRVHPVNRGKAAVAELLRYYLVAGGVAAFYIALFAGGLALGLHYMLSICAAQVVTIAVAFPIYRQVVFRSRGRVATDLLRFLSVWLSGMIAGVVATPLLVELAGFDPLVAQILAIIVVSIASFIAHKLFSFRTRDGKRATPAVDLGAEGNVR